MKSLNFGIFIDYPDSGYSNKRRVYGVNPKICTIFDGGFSNILNRDYPMPFGFIKECDTEKETCKVIPSLNTAYKQMHEEWFCRNCHIPFKDTSSADYGYPACPKCNSHSGVI